MRSAAALQLATLHFSRDMDAYIRVSCELIPQSSWKCVRSVRSRHEVTKVLIAEKACCHGSPGKVRELATCGIVAQPERETSKKLWTCVYVNKIESTMMITSDFQHGQ